MLNKKTKELMKAVYNRAYPKDGACIVSAVDLLQDIPYKYDFKREEFDPSMRSLVLEGYFELTETEKKGDTCYCINLLQAGYDFSRQIASEKRAIKFKIALTVLGCAGSMILTKIITMIVQAVGG